MSEDCGGDVQAAGGIRSAVGGGGGTDAGGEKLAAGIVCLAGLSPAAHR